MTMNSNNGFEPPATPDELRPVEAALDKLGETERAGAPVLLEQGVFVASWRRIAAERSPEPVIVRLGPAFSRGLRLAAAVGIIGALGAAWLASSALRDRAGATQLASAGGLEDDVNFLLDLRSSTDDLATLGERIDTLFLDTSSVGDSLNRDTTSVLLGDGAL